MCHFPLHLAFEFLAKYYYSFICSVERNSICHFEAPIYFCPLPMPLVLAAPK